MTGDENGNAQARPRGGWATLLARAASAVLLGHFIVSIGYWCLLVWISARGPHMPWSDWLHYVVCPAAPAVGLLGLSILSLVLAMKRKALAWVCIVITVVVSLAAFAYDVSNHRTQIHATEFSERFTGQTETYATWWWYQERHPL